MTEQRIIVRVDSLEQAIQTVIHDRRIPQRLRIALAFYQRAELNRRGISMLAGGPTEPPGMPTTFSLADVFPPYSSRSSTDGACDNLNCVTATIEQEIQVRFWHNDESLDWSIEINGQLHEHVTSETMEALVECAVIVAETSLTRALTSRTQ
jgi:hypothetical protein